MDTIETESERRWTRVLDISGRSSVLCTPAWSVDGLVAVGVHTEVVVAEVCNDLDRASRKTRIVVRIDRQDQSEYAEWNDGVKAVAWSPRGCGPCGGCLLGSAISGQAAVHVLPVGVSCLPEAETQILPSDIKRARPVSGLFGHGIVEMQPHLAFCPTPILIAQGVALATLLCFAEGDAAAVWEIQYQKPLRTKLLGRIRINGIITAVAFPSLESSWRDAAGELPLLIILGSMSGTVQLWTVPRITVGAQAAAPRLLREIAPPSSNVGVGSIAMATDTLAPMGTTTGTGEAFKTLLAVSRSHSLQLYGIRNTIPTTNDVELINFHEIQCRPAHVLPIICMHFDNLGMLDTWLDLIPRTPRIKSTIPFAAPGSSLPAQRSKQRIKSERLCDRFRLLTLDVSGRACVWRLNMNATPVYLVELGCKWSAVPKLVYNWLNPAEREAHVSENRSQLRHVPRELSCMGVAVSPSSALVLTQLRGFFPRSGHLTFLLITPMLGPEQLPVAVRYALSSSLYVARRDAVPVALPLWDIVEACILAERFFFCSRHDMNDAYKALKPVSFVEFSARLRATTAGEASGVSPVQATLLWIDSLVGLSSAIKTPPGTPIIAQSHALCRSGFAHQNWNWLASHSAQALSEADVVVRLRLHNALLQFGKRIAIGREFLLNIGLLGPARKRDARNEEPDDADRAAVCAHWRSINLTTWSAVEGSGGARSLGDQHSIEMHLSAAGDASKQLTAECRLCGRAASANAKLTKISCSGNAAHIAPLCQWSLVPISNERYASCSFCGRATLLAPQRKSSGELNCPFLVCSWCAAPVSLARIFGSNCSLEAGNQKRRRLGRESSMP